MRGVELGVLGPTDPLLDKVPTRRRRHGIFGAGDHQQRYANRRQLLAKIGITHRRAVGRIALRRSGGEHVGDFFCRRRLGLGKVRGKPAGNRGIAQRHHRRLAITQHSFDARVPHCRVADLGRGVAHHQFVQALAGVDPQPLADQPAHGQATEMHLVEVQLIKHRQHITAQLFDAVGAFGD
ncbi:hypothetical protein D3C84_869050 [compost metagenome]